MTAVAGFGRQIAFILVLFILLVIILTGICVI
jgi:thiosulfate reductase cytochrome b subunit